MKEEYADIELIKNAADHQFEMKVGGHIALIVYKEGADKITLLHTEVPQELEGRGAGTAIIEKTLKYIEKNNLKLIPLCPFVAAYIKRHPEWNRIVDRSAAGSIT